MERGVQPPVDSKDPRTEGERGSWGGSWGCQVPRQSHQDSCPVKGSAVRWTQVGDTLNHCHPLAMGAGEAARG